MASLIRTLQRACRWKRNCSSSLLRTLRVKSALSATSRFGTRTYAAEPEPATKSPFDSNIRRILQNEIEYQHEYAPPHQPETKFNSFTVEERRGEQVVTIKGKFGECEDIKIEATMFDGFEHVPACGDDSSGVNVRLRLSLIVDISKGEGDSELEFVCSAWPESLNVEKVYILRRGCMPARSYIGPDFRGLNAKVQEKFYEYLDARGVNNELVVFLHEYMMNKDRIELLHWMDSLKSFVER
ncbi:mitochondrial protein [Spatholobus suberectus]|nr:mitochondrial protein [Spatholobus suberectus]